MAKKATVRERGFISGTKQANRCSHMAKHWCINTHMVILRTFRAFYVHVLTCEVQGTQPMFHVWSAQQPWEHQAFTVTEVNLYNQFKSSHI